MTGRTAPACPGLNFDSKTPVRPAAYGAVFPSYLYHMPAHDERRQARARALRAALFNSSLYVRKKEISRTVGNALFLLVISRPSIAVTGGAGRPYACGAVASVCICPFFSGALALIYGVAGCPACCHRIGGV